MRPISWRLSCTVLLMLAGPHAEARQSGADRPEPAAQTRGTVSGTVRRATREPVPEATVRLRDLVAGGANTIRRTDADGLFRFDRVVPGQYLAELVDENDQVRAVSDILLVVPGDITIAEIILPAKLDRFGALFWRSSMAVLTSATAGGILGLAATGRTASPER